MLGDPAIADRRPIYILNGPNLNLLGAREPEIYGATSLADIEAAAKAHAATHGLSLDFRQSNHEGALVDWVQESAQSADGLILNAGAYTHTSIALLDALKACPIFKIELHLSNPQARETFRHTSFVGRGCDGSIAGFGADGYLTALDAMARVLEKPPKT